MVIFDTETPIAPQLAQVRAVLEHKQSLLSGAHQTFRPRRSLLPRYLRVLDGFRELGASVILHSYATACMPETLRQMFHLSLALVASCERWHGVLVIYHCKR
jgi:hypothetical protein